MVKLSPAFMAIAFLSGCTAVPKEPVKREPVISSTFLSSSRQKVEEVKVECFGEVSDSVVRYRQDSVLELRPNYADRCRPVEEGSINGVDFTIYHTDGSASFYNEREVNEFFERDRSWSVACETDSFSDLKHCTISREGIFIFVSSNSYYVNTGGDTYPGTNIDLRVDQGQSYSVSENDGLTGQRARRFINDAAAGEKILTRYVLWPSGAYRQYEISSRGLRESLDYISSKL